MSICCLVSVVESKDKDSILASILGHARIFVSHTMTNVVESKEKDSILASILGHARTFVLIWFLLTIR